jgi:hypothetical protein
MNCRIVFLLMFSFAAISSVNAQDRARLSGKVMDPNGAVVAGASVHLRSADGSVNLKGTTDETGRYRFEAFAGDRLTLDVEAAGFLRGSRTIRAGAEEENITLELASLNETLLVTTGTRSPMEIDKSPVSTSLVTRSNVDPARRSTLEQFLHRCGQLGNFCSQRSRSSRGGKRAFLLFIWRKRDGRRRQSRDEAGQQTRNRTLQPVWQSRHHELFVARRRSILRKARPRDRLQSLSNGRI